MDMKLTTNHSVIIFLTDVFNDIAFMDMDDIDKNVDLLSNNRLLIEYRSIPTKLYSYLLDNFCYLFLSLINNSAFRNSIIDTFLPKAISFKNDIQNDNKDCKIIDFTKYDNETYVSFCKKVLSSFDKLNSCTDYVDEYMQHLSYDDMKIIGKIVSNFAYLIKALCVDASFVKYVVSVIQTTKDTLNAI